MRIVAMSDTHSFNERIAVPDGDVLIHAGDSTDSGRPDEIFAAYAWLSKLPHERIIVTPGNHDFGFQKVPALLHALTSKFPRIETLIDAETTLGALRVFCSPWQPWFHDWAYNFLPGPAGIQPAEEKWSEIPDDVAVLVTHGPCYGVLDETLRGEFVGCVAMKARIAQLKRLRLHVFGHVHEAYGTQRIGDVLHVNASVCDARYSPEQKPWVLDWDSERLEVV